MGMKRLLRRFIAKDPQPKMDGKGEKIKEKTIPLNDSGFLAAILPSKYQNKGDFIVTNSYLSPIMIGLNINIPFSDSLHPSW